MAYTELPGKITHAGKLKVGVESQHRREGQAPGLCQQRFDNFQVRAKQMEHEIRPEAAAGGQPIQMRQQGERRILLSGRKLEIKKDMLDTTLVPEPGNEILEHRRHRLDRGFSVSVIARHRLTTNVSARSPERCECELTDRSPPWRAQRRHIRHIEESLAAPLAC
jgi:hypothetical protein